MPRELVEQLLADKRRCGLYRIAPGRADVGEGPAQRWQPLAPLPRIDRTNLLAALGTALAFPAYYGQNWDAAWDCLTELDWPAGQLLLVHLPIPADAAVVEADLEIFLELMGDACQHWAERDRALCLLVETARADLDCLRALPVLA